MSLNDLNEKIAKNLKERVELKIEQQKLKRAEKERIQLNKDRIKRKQEAELLHRRYLETEQLEQDVKEYKKTDEWQLFEASEQAKQNIQRDIAMGLTKEEIKFKYLDEDARIRQMNKEAEEGNQTVLQRTRARFRSHIDDMY